MKIGIVIVTYNGAKWIEKCLKSLAQCRLPLSIVVIDNLSKDDTVAIIKAHFSTVKLIESKENLGFGKANNLGIKYCLSDNCEYIFLLNQDTWLKSDRAIEMLLETILKNPNFGIISPLHYNGTAEKLDLLFEKYITKNHPNIEVLLLSSNIAEVDFVNAAAWFVQAKIGLFDPLFAHYGEDTDFVQRLKYHQLKIGVCPQVSIVHDRPQSTHQNANTLKYKHYLYIMYLNKLKDVNHSLLHNVVYTFIDMAGKALKAILKGQYYVVNFLFLNGIQLFSQLKNINDSRRIAKNANFPYF